MNRDCIHYDDCDYKDLSACCSAKIYDDTDICSECREHTSDGCEDCNDYTSRIKLVEDRIDEFLRREDEKDKIASGTQA